MTDKAVTIHDEQAIQVFDPLDAEPIQFKKQLESRQANYDALSMHVQNVLVHRKDYGRIHIEKAKSKGGNCEKPWHCTYEKAPHHWSDYRLFKSGADKILGLLGLAATYPDEKDYRQAALKGMPIEDVVVKCFIDNGRGGNVAEGLGAAARSKHNGDLNNTIKKACKRARLDAVERLPSISALFESDFLAEIAQGSKGNGGNTASQRQRQPSGHHTTGAELTHMPFGPFKDEAFTDLPESQLDWCVNTCTKHDVIAAGKKELDRRADMTTQSAARPAAAEGRSDDLPPVDIYED